jgi:ABC-type bacteriocin/lantibiotic exporter with double-glycine peptidase domain
MVSQEVGNSENFKDAGNSITFNHSIELRDISFGYEGQALILNRSSLTIRKGEKIAITGKSGVGKTSLLLILLRFLKESTGEIVIDGEKLQDADTIAWRKNIGYISQNPYFLDASVAENIAFGISADQINLKLIEELIADLDLGSWVNQLPNRLQTIIGEKGVKISGGQRQRLAIARALYQNAEVLLLDEITNQLDVESELEIIQILEKTALQKKTILMITHHVHLLTRFDRVITIEKGTILEKSLSPTSL